jgi:hypothetical protein
MNDGSWSCIHARTAIAARMTTYGTSHHATHERRKNQYSVKSFFIAQQSREPGPGIGRAVLSARPRRTAVALSERATASDAGRVGVGIRIGRRGHDAGLILAGSVIP